LERFVVLGRHAISDHTATRERKLTTMIIIFNRKRVLIFRPAYLAAFITYFFSFNRFQWFFRPDCKRKKQRFACYPTRELFNLPMITICYISEIQFR